MASAIPGEQAESRPQEVTPVSNHTDAHPVVVGVDDSPGARNAAQYAAELAGVWGVDLVVAHASRLGEWVPEHEVGLFEDLRSVGQRLVDDVVGNLRVPPRVQLTAVAELATPAELLGRLSATAQVVVLGRHESGWLESTLR